MHEGGIVERIKRTVIAINVLVQSKHEKMVAGKRIDAGERIRSENQQLSIGLEKGSPRDGFISPDPDQNFTPRTEVGIKRAVLMQLNDTHRSNPRMPPIRNGTNKQDSPIGSDLNVGANIPIRFRIRVKSLECEERLALLAKSCVEHAILT